MHLAHLSTGGGGGFTRLDEASQLQSGDSIGLRTAMQVFGEVAEEIKNPEKKINNLPNPLTTIGLLPSLDIKASFSATCSDSISNLARIFFGFRIHSWSGLQRVIIDRHRA